MEGSLVYMVVAAVAVAIVAGIALGFLIRQTVMGRRVREAERQAQSLLDDAQDKKKEVLLEAKEESIRIKAAAETENRAQRAEVQRQERRLSQKEENLDRKTDALERRERGLGQKEREIENLRSQADEVRKKQVRQLELISGMSSAEAKNLLMTTLEGEVKEDINRRIREMEVQMKEEADQRGRDIVVQAVQRCATDVVSETTVSVVPLPSDDMKGRLIGREGRNIRALEGATGVDLIIDDTPEAVTISCFDPVRREVARVALNKLIQDGRIHPARIEEIVQKSRNEVENVIKVEGEAAAQRAGVPSLPQELIKLLGRLKYRTSYGQNVLQHSLETSFLAGTLAAELGADVMVAKTAGLLHDIGKAVDHEVEGPHALIGADIVKRLIRSPDVVRAVAEHHLDQDSTSLQGFIISTADAISSSRPGARRESLEQYLKRLEALEGVANSFDGVEKSFAIQAGREVRILVKPEAVDDLGAVRLARDIVKKIEESLHYPGQIKVTVIRETRAVDYAK